MIETPYVKVEKVQITGEVVYMNAMEEEKYYIAHSGAKYVDDKKSVVIVKFKKEQHADFYILDELPRKTK
jgi:DNA-directed RNA polymerase beta subunit